jgi:Flp pilus assembly protein TadG
MRNEYLIRKYRQAGVASVEMALCCMIFFTIVFGILEFGRMMYLYNTMQEVTRRAAREATVRWVDKTSTIKDIALFGSSSVPAAPEITATNVRIRYLNAAGAEVTTYPSDPGDNMSACNDITRTNECIRSVSVSLESVTYTPLVSLFSFLSMPMPTTTVVMYAESLGFND